MAHGNGSTLPTSTLVPITTIASVAREDRPSYEARPGGDPSGLDAPIAVLTEGDRDDVVRYLQDAEAALREVFPELVLALAEVAGGEFLVRDTAQAMGRLSIATRVVEDRVADGPPDASGTGNSSIESSG